MNLLRQLHRWVGLTLALAVVAVSVSGALLLFRAPYYRLVHPVMATPITDAQVARRAELLHSIEARWRDVGVQLIKFPRPEMNAYQVWLRDGSQAFVEPHAGVVLDRWQWHERLPPFLFELHAHLFADRPGTIVNGIAALFVVCMALSGIVLWWPARGSAFRLRGVIPRRGTRPDLLRSHAAAGVIAFVPIMLFVATGALMAFYQPVGRALSLAVDGRAPAEANARVAPRAEPALPWSALLPIIDGVIPEGETVYYYPAIEQNARLMFRKRVPGEWHPNGRSYVVLDPYDGRVVQTIDARAQGMATRFMNTIYPLHAATVGGPAMVAAGFVAGVALTWLAGAGAWTFIRLLVTRKRTKPNQVRAAA